MGKKKPKSPERPERIEFETFRQMGGYEVSNLKQKEPSCFNGILRVRKFRVVVEPIEEPVLVLRERVQRLWSNDTNHHHSLILIEAAKELGFELEGSMGDGADGKEPT